MTHSNEPESDDSASPSPLHPGEPPDRLAFEPVPLRPRHDGLTPRKQREYVEALADTGVVREAAARIGISEQAINRVRRRADARSFDGACEAAHMFGARRLRSIAYERAIEGTLKGHYYHGELVSQERVHDNRLLIYLLGKVEPLLDPPKAALAICETWEPWMDALEQGLPPPGPGGPEPAGEALRIEGGGAPQVWCEDGVWWTIFPPPEGFDGIEEGESADGDYQRSLTEEEQAVMKARGRATDAAALARCCAVRDDYFGLPHRGHSETFFPQGSRNNETSEEEEEEEEEDGEGPLEYKSLVPPPSFRRKPESMNMVVRESGPRCSWIPDQVRDDALPQTVIPGGTPSKYYFDGNPEAGIHERRSSNFPRPRSWIRDHDPSHIQSARPRHPCR